MVQPFPTDWRTALVLVPHPDDPEYGSAAAVAKWTSAGKTVRYVLACRGEAGISGMPPEETARCREAEQRQAAAVVGVRDVHFWDFPDSNIRNCPELRDKIAGTLEELKPDVVLTIYGGREFAPGAPNQRDHMEFAAAVVAAYDRLVDPPRWLFSMGPAGTHIDTVDGFIDVAIESLAAHEKYLAALDPDTPVVEQARKVLDMTTPARADTGGRRAVGFILERSR
ncbi:MAG: PIG-L family deacetylase [Mycobacterium sp.]|nr:PIG-L family deacetylase [Mycobacterium sp.]